MNDVQVCGCAEGLRHRRECPIKRGEQARHSIRRFALPAERPESAKSSEWVTAPDGEEFRVGACQGHRESENG